MLDYRSVYTFNHCRLSSTCPPTQSSAWIHHPFLSYLHFQILIQNINSITPERSDPINFNRKKTKPLRSFKKKHTKLSLSKIVRGILLCRVSVTFSPWKHPSLYISYLLSLPDQPPSPWLTTTPGHNKTATPRYWWVALIASPSAKPNARKFGLRLPHPSLQWVHLRRALGFSHDGG